jgi:hypothetical protein
MSGQLAGQPKALPFTGLATAPIALVGLVLTAVGFLLARVRPHRSGA